MLERGNDIVPSTAWYENGDEVLLRGMVSGRRISAHTIELVAHEMRTRVGKIGRKYLITDAGPLVLNENSRIRRWGSGRLVAHEELRPEAIIDVRFWRQGRRLVVSTLYLVG